MGTCEFEAKFLGKIFDDLVLYEYVKNFTYVFYKII